MEGMTVCGVKSRGVLTPPQGGRFLGGALLGSLPCSKSQEIPNSWPGSSVTPDSTVSKGAHAT